MSKRTYAELKDVLCNELSEITRKGDIDRQSLDDVYKLTSTITMIESLLKKKGDMGADEEYSNEGGSNAYRRSMRDSYDDMSYRMGNSRDYAYRNSNANSYEPYSRDDSYEYSEARGRDGRTGRYVSRDGYSRHTEEEKITYKLEDMLETSRDQRTRDAIAQALNMLK